MALTGSINVDEAAQTVQIAFEDGGVPLTDHTYSGITGRVASAALAGIALSLAEYEAGGKLLTPFLQMVRLRHNPAKGKEGEFAYEMEKDMTMVKMTATLGSTTIGATWDSETDIVTIEPRDTLDLSWADFLLFLSLPRLLVKKSKEF